MEQEQPGKPPTVAQLLERLGVPRSGIDIDETIRWALLEIMHRRQDESAEQPS